MINNKLRIGNFTSSEIVALTKEGKAKGSFGTAALTYIEETNYERRLGRSLTDEVFAKPLMWGKLLESFVFDRLGLEYILTSSETKVHPRINYWAGSKDGYKNDPGKTVIDIKAPLTLKSFCQLVDPLYKGLCGMDAMNAVRDNHKDGEKFYWQLISNAVIEDAQYAELVVYMPFQRDLAAVKQHAQDSPPELLSKYYWVTMALDDELPFIKDDGYYQDLNIIRFEVPQSDKVLLTEKVIKAGELLINNPSVMIAEYDQEVNAMIVNAHE